MIRLPLWSAGAAVTFAALTVLAQAIEGPKPQRVDRLEVYSGNRGEEVLRCLYSSFLPPRGARIEVDRKRMLCVLGDGQRLAWYWRFEVGSTGATEHVVLDVERGSWLAMRTDIAIEPRRVGESWEAWKRRYLDADPALVTIRIETNTLKLDAHRETHLEEARGRWWERITTDQPELAQFLRALVTAVGKPSEGMAATLLIAPLIRVVYGGEQPTPSNLMVKVQETRPDADQGVTDFERSFGRWASWPDPPRLRP